MSQIDTSKLTLYRIRPLVWRNAKNPNDAGQYLRADTIFGEYYVASSKFREEKQASWRWSFCEYYDEGTVEAATVVEAKAAAEGHYLARLLIALEVVPTARRA